MPKKGRRDGAQERAEQSLAAIDKLGGSYVWESELFAVTLSGTAVTDADLALLEHLPSLQMLYLDDTTITDAALDRLINQKSLETLGIINTGVSQEAIQRLQRANPSLRIQTEPLKGGVNPLTGKPL